MEISQEEFFEKRYYYDAEKDIHISWCIDEGIGPLGLWISTFGLACYKGNSIIENNFFSDALFSQKVILSLLIKEARRLMDEEGTYDTTCGYYEDLRNLAHTLFNNLLFYYELVGKCYLTFCKVEFPKTHRLAKILELVKRTMFQNKHNDSLFHLYIIKEFQMIVDHISILPAEFKEEYVKYNDNRDDNTLIVFNNGLLDEMERVIEVGCDFVTFSSEYERANDDHISFFKQGIYQLKIEKATGAEDRKKREEFYKFLIEEPTYEEE
jgi:hypothetical protein